MTLDTKKTLNELLKRISEMTLVRSIGISGKKISIPQPGEGDIDVFIYCEEIPGTGERQGAINSLEDRIEKSSINVLQGGHWGVGDYALINGVEVWLMYFTLNETTDEIEAILRGEYPDKLDNYYYPIGRCATLRDIKILHDTDDFLLNLKKMLSVYPDQLARILTEYHLDKLDDTEDMERAAARRDVLFYHFALDIAIDHFLQVLFALNKTYFPSRKRTIELIDGFKIKPEKCNERLLEIVAEGSTSEGLFESYELWIRLVKDLIRLKV